MRRSILALVVTTGCISGPRPREHDTGLLREITQQERWTDDALAGRPSPSDLERIRQGDFEAVATGRKKLRRLTQAIDRGTWIREAVIEARREGESDPALVRTFDRMGTARRDAAAAADELADALAEARGGLTMADLRPGFDALRKAQDSDARLPRDLRPAPLPVPRPLLSAAGKVVHAHPEAARELDRLPPDDATQIRAQAAEADLHDRAAAPAQDRPMITNQGRDGEQQAPAPADALTMSAEVQQAIAERGPPKAIVARPDGYFGLRYDDVELVYDPSGKKVREEPVQR